MLKEIFSDLAIIPVISLNTETRKFQIRILFRHSEGHNMKSSPGITAPWGPGCRRSPACNPNIVEIPHTLSFYI
jgi:hypothetical protein